MTVQEVFIGSEHALTSVVDQIKDEQWSMQMPPEFARRDTGKLVTLREIVNYHAYDDAWVPDTLAGKTKEEVGSKYDGDLLGDDPKQAWHQIVDKAIDAVQDCDLEVTVHLSYGDYPSREYLRHIISFRALRAVDIARVIGVSDQLPEALAQSVYDLLAPDAEAFRQIGVYGPRVDVPSDADIQAKLLGMTGRQP